MAQDRRITMFKKINPEGNRKISYLLFFPLFFEGICSRFGLF